MLDLLLDIRLHMYAKDLRKKSSVKNSQKFSSKVMSVFFRLSLGVLSLE